MSIELKIKSKHLSEEAKIIRHEEKKLKAAARSQREHQYHDQARASLAKYESLYLHRTYDVRNENRATFLARAYLRGVPYSSVERSRKEEGEYNFIVKVIPRILTMINKYRQKGSSEYTKQDLLDWIKT